MSCAMVSPSDRDIASPCPHRVHTHPHRVHATHVSPCSHRVHTHPHCVHATHVSRSARMHKTLSRISTKELWHYGAAV
eukprot:2112238-Rhodomonas_salina.1